MDFQEIECVRLNPTQKTKALAILRRGNLLLRKWADEFYPAKKFRQFRNALLNGEKNPLNKIPANRLDHFHDELPTILVIRHKPQDYLDGRTIEEAILQNFSAAAKKYAHKWSLSGSTTGITKQDYLEEAYRIIIEALYQYTRDDIEISTWVFAALKNGMINVTNQQGNLLSHLTNEDLELMSRYEGARKEMNGHATFDQIVETLGLSDAEGRQLNVLLTRVFAENQLGGSQGNEEDDPDSGNDYTGHRVGVDRESETEIYLQKQYVIEVLDRAGLNDLEREVIEIAMDPYYGWQTEFAKTHINKDTGKPYSRMRVSQLLDLARAKVVKVMSRQEAAA